MNADTHADWQSLLGRLEDLLARQIRCAKAEDYCGVSAIEAEVARALEQTAGLLGEPRPGPGPEPAPEVLEQARRIRALRGNLKLILAHHRHDLAGKLGRLRQGKGTLQAYRDNSTRI